MLLRRLDLKSTTAIEFTGVFGEEIATYTFRPDAEGFFTAEVPDPIASARLLSIGYLPVEPLDVLPAAPAPLVPVATGAQTIGPEGAPVGPVASVVEGITPPPPSPVVTPPPVAQIGLSEARGLYKAMHGKAASPRWTADQIAEKLIPGGAPATDED